MSAQASSDQVFCPTCGGALEVIATDASGQRTALCSYCYATITLGAEGRAAPVKGKQAEKAETSRKAEPAKKAEKTATVEKTAKPKPAETPKQPQKPKKPERAEPPDPATIVRAVLARAGLAATGSPGAASRARIQALTAEQVRIVERIGVHVAHLRRLGEVDMAEAFSALAGAVALGGDLNQHMRSDALELIDELSRQASRPEQERSGKAVLRSVLAGLGSTLVGAGALTEAWRSSSRRIEEFFGID
jgi:type IV secretory pathway VirB10-like protein